MVKVSLLAQVIAFALLLAADNAFAQRRHPQTSNADQRLQRQPDRRSNLVRQTTMWEESFTETIDHADVPSVTTAGHDTCACSDSSSFCNVCQPRPYVWWQLEYLLWWGKGVEMPALASTSPRNTPQDDAGVPGAPGTSILFGNAQLHEDSRSGGRASLGLPLYGFYADSIEVTYAALEEDTQVFSGSSNNFPILARPFFDAGSGEGDSRLISYPNVVDGELWIESLSEFQTAEVLFRRTTRSASNWHLDVLWGYRFADLNDAVRVRDSTLSLSGPTVDARLSILDSFVADNEFHGGEFGIHVVGAARQCWSIDFLAKIAIGDSRYRAAVSGTTTSTSGTGDTNTLSSGLLALDSNIGTYEENKFSTFAECGIRLRRQLPCGFTATFAYTLLGWSDVLRAGEQIDDHLNLTQIPPTSPDGPQRPVFPFETTSFWAQGVAFGVEHCF